MSATTQEFTFHHSKGQRGQRQIHNGKPPKPTSPGRVPRISRLMALAIRFDGLIADGELADYADIAHLGHVTRARVTQIMSLLMLAPDIQEALLHLPLIQLGRDPITERQMRPMTKTLVWQRQRRLFSRLIDRPSSV